jgi:hypothetical protein
MKVADVFGIFILYTFAAVAVLLPLYVIVRSIVNFVRAMDGRGTIVLKAVVSLVVWVIISVTFMFIPFMLAFEPGSKDPVVADRIMTAVVIGLTIIYIVIALALVYWVRLQPGWRTQKGASHGA